MAHEGGGLTEHAKNSARRLAEAGYIAFALDYYGDGQPLPDLTQAMPRIMAWMADPTGIRARAHAALEVLTAQPETDAAGSPASATASAARRCWRWPAPASP